MIKRKHSNSIKRIIKKQRNPSVPNNIKDILRFADNIKYLKSGAEADVYYFEMPIEDIVDNSILSPGKYVLKYYFREWLDRKHINYLRKLYDKKLIPKIYIINDRFIVMKFIGGKSLEELIDSGKFKSLTSKRELIEKLKNELQKWHDHNFIHNDIDLANILINEDKIWFIDPDVSWIDEIRLTEKIKNSELEGINLNFLEFGVLPQSVGQF